MLPSLSTYALSGVAVLAAAGINASVTLHPHFVACRSHVHPLRRRLTCTAADAGDVAVELVDAVPAGVPEPLVQAVRDSWTSDDGSSYRAIEHLLRHIVFAALTDEQRNRLYGVVYQLARPEHSGPRWGEENACSDLPRLVHALDVLGFLAVDGAAARPPPRILLVWESWESPAETRSHHYHLQRRGLSHGRVVFVNGANLPRDGAHWDASRFSDAYLDGHNMHCVYNASARSGLLNLAVTSPMHGGICTPPVRLLLDEWAHFFWNARSDETILQVAFSQGSVIVRNALSFLDAEHRRRVRVLLITPACFIAPEPGVQVAHVFKFEDPVLLAAEGYASTAANARHVIAVPHGDNTHPHDPHGHHYRVAAKPLVDRWRATGSFWEDEEGAAVK